MKNLNKLMFLRNVKYFSILTKISYTNDTYVQKQFSKNISYIICIKNSYPFHKTRKLNQLKALTGTKMQIGFTRFFTVEWIFNPITTVNVSFWMTCRKEKIIIKNVLQRKISFLTDIMQLSHNPITFYNIFVWTTNKMNSIY